MHSSLRKEFDSTFMLVSWQVWKERNRRVFGGEQHQAAALVSGIIIKEGRAWVQADAKFMAALGWPAAVLN
ncbi:hypothetical protein C2845_PM09G21490 [Panicum miliaceum]|uniref:Uncharacterized protein n=1 Tax=Panicum miliaceum TaxID=4540 RepID=A0A3L6S3R3_PANMI|nr:hypothetical protein C2845_PM09G21490 [Panicum miliaceum]